MKSTKTRLKEIIKEELATTVEEGEYRGNPNKPWDAFFPPSESEEQPGQTDKLLKDLKGIVQALGGENLNAHNLETVQGILDGLKASVME